MTTSVFLAEANQSHFVLVTDVVNVLDNLSQLTIGAGTGKFPTITPRRSSIHSWHLESPVSGTSIPKTAIIDGVKIEVVPDVTNAADLETRTEFGFAFMRPDGHWDRSREHPLHQQQGAASYGPPLVSSSIVFQVFNENTTIIAGTIGPTASGGNMATFTSDGEDFNQTFGTTIQIPANEQIASVGIELGRNDSPGTNPDVRVNLYSLTKNERYQSLDTLIATSDAIPYLSLPTTASGNSLEQIFTFDPVIAAESEDRWVGFMIEGEWFDPDNASSHRILVNRTWLNQHPKDDTFGSFMVASKVPAVQFENSFVGYYEFPRDVPGIWRNVGPVWELVVPMERRLGDIFIYDFDEVEDNDLTWNAGEPVSFGTMEYGATVGLTNDIVAGLQAYIDSDDYDPRIGRVWLGLMFDRRAGLFTLWRFAGPGHATYSAIKLIIDWHPRRINVV